jgi:hypothetical protein
MMVYEGNELIGLLIKVYAIVLLTGIIALSFVPVRIKPIISVIAVFPVALLLSIYTVKGLLNFSG